MPGVFTGELGHYESVPSPGSSCIGTDCRISSQPKRGYGGESEASG
jgi:hypothetical protein